jgi:AcrR family transcriptional regulator
VSILIKQTKRTSPAIINQGTNRVRGRATGRVTKKQWIETALEALVIQGCDGVRVVTLAKQLNISESGFYWHFENRDDLLNELKRYWADEFSQQIISEVIGQDASLQEKLRATVLAIRNKQSGKFDLAFTSWAQHDLSVRELVDQIRDMRISFIKALLAEGGFTGDDLEAHARIFVVYFS